MDGGVAGGGGFGSCVLWHGLGRDRRKSVRHVTGVRLPKDDSMKFLIRMAVDASTNTPSSASWDEEVVAGSKRAAARRFRTEHGLPKAEPLVISEVIPVVVASNLSNKPEGDKR